MRITSGMICEIRPAYSCETESRSIWDNIAGCQAEVLAPCGQDGDVLVWVQCIGEVWVNHGRLKLIGVKTP